MPRPIVALVGRPNVGKSTLFNRLVGERRAIVADLPGTTRDRLYADADWAGQDFTLVDTGGISLDTRAALEADVAAQARLAIAEADVVVFATDTREGVTPVDQDIAQLLRQSGKPVVLAVTKAESEAQVLAATEFYQLGLGEPYAVSGLQGYGTGDLLDAIVAHLRARPMAAAPAEELPRLAIVGRPNVGKSSVLNALVGGPRALVSPVPGTTRDAIDARVVHGDTPLVLLDTAGIRRRGRVQRGIEHYSVLRAVRAMQRADVTLLLLDGAEGPTAQDAHIAGYAVEAGTGLVLVVNKWDVVEKTPRIGEEYTQVVRAALGFLDYAPIVFVSAKTGQRLGQMLDLALEVYRQRQRRIGTSELNRVIRRAVLDHPPPSRHGRQPNVLYVTQVQAEPPTFVFFVNDPDLLHLTYRRYLQNELRRAFGFPGVPLRLFFRAHERARQRA
ncbi:MAG: ribosome biogenesis GTPase Der [Chloroflexi bacterium]|nr:ribosome biogenesis GTPase Der [Chloroflexota bacterium]MBI4504789.1 ribosome biogenesis GTPase Der [Chloroflexota bacterium]